MMGVSVFVAGGLVACSVLSLVVAWEEHQDHDHVGTVVWGLGAVAWAALTVILLLVLAADGHV